jgi:hypothetical protein
MSLTRATASSFLAISLLIGGCGTPDVSNFESASESLQALSNTEMEALVGQLHEVDSITPGGCAASLKNEFQQARDFRSQYAKAVSRVTAYSNALSSLAISAEDADAHADKIAESLSALATAANLALPGAGSAAQQVFKQAIALLAEAEVRNSLKKTLEAGQPVVNCVAVAAEDLFAPSAGGQAAMNGTFNPYDEFIDSVFDQEIGIRECLAGIGLIQAYRQILMDTQTNIDLEREIACLAVPGASKCRNLPASRTAKELEVVLKLVNDQRQRYQEFEENVADAAAWSAARKKNWTELGQKWRKWAAAHAALSREMTTPWPWSAPAKIDLQCVPPTAGG